MTDEDVARLLTVSRSRTKPANGVLRAQILLAYRENPRIFAVGQRFGVHHQTVLSIGKGLARYRRGGRVAR